MGMLRSWLSWGQFSIVAEPGARWHKTVALAGFLVGLSPG